MKKEKPIARRAGNLRRRAEATLKKKRGKLAQSLAEENARGLVHELQVHQVELEMQNEELRRANLEVEETLSKYSDLYDFSPVGYFTFDKQGKILEVNLTGARLLDLERGRLLNQSFQIFLEPVGRPVFQAFCREVLATETRQTCEVKLLPKRKHFIHVEIEGIVKEDSGGKGKVCRAAVIDITLRKQAEEALQYALRESRQRQTEIAALLESSRAVLRYNEFKEAAWSIFNSAKNLIGAPSGYIALLSQDGSENELLFLDAGGLPCTVDPSLPMPIRGFRKEAYDTGRTAFHNSFPKSKWTQYLPEGHVSLENVLFAPLKIEGKVVGILGLANKPGGFTDHDAELASAFGEHAAIALYNSRALETLGNSEERFRAVVQTATDAIISVDSQGKIVFWNPGAERMFGYRAEEVSGQSLSVIIPPTFRGPHQQGMKRYVTSGESEIIGRTIEVGGVRKGGIEFPLELSLSAWKTKEGNFFTGIIRDITERKRAEEEIEHLARFPAENPHPVLRLNQEGIILYANESSRELLRAWDCAEGGYAPPFCRQWVTETLQNHARRTIEVEVEGQVYAVIVAPVPSAGYVNLYGMDITDRKRMETAIRRAKDELEMRVQERTAELLRANEALRIEIEERKRAEESLQQSEKQLKELSSQLLVAQENERRRIARELHDGIGQALSAAKFSLERKLSQMGGGAPPPGITLEDIIPILQEGIAEVRKISTDLWPSLLDDLGILATISWFCRQFQTVYSNIRIERQVGVEEEEVPHRLKVIIYRILQEAMNNAAKYSQAGVVHLSLDKRNGDIELAIKDNGVGFDPESCRKGLGLASMKERTELSGGAFSIHSVPGNGTVVRAAWKIGAQTR